ncbi:hypothetical protein LX36DRAFT_180226 [Colletotrichum falcatum]|nr:hypothetical protein LX36DRAFT_180226 [Colletotrichum falcatum]
MSLAMLLLGGLHEATTTHLLFSAMPPPHVPSFGILASPFSSHRQNTDEQGRKVTSPASASHSLVLTFFCSLFNASIRVSPSPEVRIPGQGQEAPPHSKQCDACRCHVVKESALQVGLPLYLARSSCDLAVCPSLAFFPLLSDPHWPSSLHYTPALRSIRVNPWAGPVCICICTFDKGRI